MRNLILFISLIIFHSANAQNDGPVEITPAIQKKINLEVEKAVAAEKKVISPKDFTGLEIEFRLDTFRIEKNLELSMDYDFSTSGMANACYEAAHRYDSLLNKYYKRLSARLQGEDKKALISAQKAWIAFRDAEEKLVITVSKDEYSGGGTRQRIENAWAYLLLVKQRTLEIFNHLDRISIEDED